MAQLTLYVPDLSTELFADAGGEIDATRWPALALMLGRANARPLDAASVEHTLFVLCGVAPEYASSISIAAVTALIDKDLPAPANIMRADPVHLRADPNQILLFDHPTILPSAAEADALLEELNAGLPELQLSRGTHPARWYFCSEHAATSVTTSPHAANGRSISAFLPRGAGAKHFTQLMNDAQMLLHGAAVNIAREARGVPPINSIWPWGGGVALEGRISAPDLVVGDDVVTAGIARICGAQWQLALEPSEIIAKIERTKRSALAVIGSPTGSIEANATSADLDALEQDWCQTVLQSLRRFRVNEVQLVTDRHCYTLTPWTLFKVWRRPATREAA